MHNNITNIVLLGGGYSTIWAYRSLTKGLDYELLFGDVRITVVCPEEHHVFHGWTAESLGGIIQDGNRKTSLTEIFQKAELVRGAASAIDAKSRQVQVTLNDGSAKTLSYDHLLIGIGAFDSEKIEGIKEFGYQVKSPSAFTRTKEAIQALVEQAATATTAEEAKKLLRFTVAGSGFSGVELVTNIAELVAVLKKGYRSLRGINPVIRLVSSKGRILDELDPRFSGMRGYAERTLKQYGIEVVYDSKITRITPAGAWLSDGRMLESSMVISATGQSRMLLEGTGEMTKDHLNRLCTDSHLQVPGYPNIWGCGDACNVPYRNTGRPCEANALWAIKQGEHAGMNIARAVRGKALRMFNYHGMGQCASLGIGKGMGELYGMEFTGWLAWILRWVFFNYFMPSRKVMVREMMDWAHLLFTGRRKGLPVPGKEAQQVPGKGAQQLPGKEAQQVPGKFEGKVCWITGASGGIGAALARKLSRSGAFLILSARNVAGLEEVKASCAHPEKVEILPCDMDKPELLEGVAGQAWNIRGAIDYAFLNAGMAIRDLVVNTGLEMVQKVMNVNFVSNTVISKVLLPRMVERGSGRFVVTSSICGRFGVPKLSAYSASKHALHGYFEALQAEHEAQGIKVTMMTSGLVRTNITMSALRGDGRPYARMQESVGNGIAPAKCADEIVRAVIRGRREALVGGVEKYGVLVKRFFPGVFAWAIGRHPLRRLRSLTSLSFRKGVGGAGQVGGVLGSHPDVFSSDHTELVRVII